MPRAYTMSEKAKAARIGNAAAARAAQNSPDALLTRIERAKANLTPAQWDRLRSLLGSAPKAADEG